jgi:hypothetical protein
MNNQISIKFLILWIGLSLISIFEVVQLLLECCAFGVNKCRQSKSRDKYKDKSKQANTKNGTKLRQQHSK